MPFPLVYRVPKSIEDKVLIGLRSELVRITSELMNCPEHWVGPDFFRSALEDPQDSDEGCATVLIKLETGLFEGSFDDESQIQKVLEALANSVFEAFGGKYQVESVLSVWEPGWNHLRKVLYCEMPECNGTLGVVASLIQTDCHSISLSSSSCRACTTCGRVHSHDGGLMYGRAGHSPFLREDGIESVLLDIEFVPGESYKTTKWLWTIIDGIGGELETGSELIFYCMDEKVFCFVGEDGVKYRLHRGNVNFVKPILAD